MWLDKEYEYMGKKYCAVRFLEKPYEDIDIYVCVPTSWIRGRQRYLGKFNVKVIYPIEDPETTKERVKNEERHKNHWKTYKAIFVIDFVNYVDANAWIKESYKALEIYFKGSQSSAALESNSGSILPNQSLYPDKNEPQEQSNVAAEDFANHRDNQETDDTIETNSYNRNTDEQRLNTPATPPLLDEDQQLRLAQLINGGTPLTINGGQLRQQPRNQELPVNQIAYKTHPQNDTKNTSFPFQKPTKPVSHTSLSKRLKAKQNQSNQIIKNKTADVNKRSDTENQVNEVFQDLHEKTLPPYKVIIKNDYNVNKIIITRSTEIVNDDQGTSSQRTAENISSVNKTNDVKHISQRIKRAIEKKLIRIAPKPQLQPDLSINNTIIKSTGEESVNLLVHSHYKANSTPSAGQYFPNAENKMSQFSKPANELNISTDLQKMRQITQDQRVLAGEYNTREYNISNYFHQTPGLQEVTQNIPPFVHNVQTSASQPSTELSHQNPNPRAKRNCTERRPGLQGATHNIPSVVNHLKNTAIQPHHGNSYQNHLQAHVQSYLLQDPRTGLLYIDPAIKSNYYDQRQYAQGPTQNMPPAFKNIQNLANQSGQYSQHPHENQYIPCSHYTLPTQRPQQTFARGPVEMNSAYQRASYPQNVPYATQNSSNAANCSCPYLHGRPHAPVAQAHYYQDPRLQRTFPGRSNEANPSAQSVCLNKETRPPVIVNPISTSNQPRLTLRNSVNEQFTPALTNYSNQKPLQEQPVEQNYVKQNNFLQDNTQKGQTAQFTKISANKLLGSAIEEQHSQLNADQEMSVMNHNGQNRRQKSETKDKSTALPNAPNAVNVISERKIAEQNLIKDLKLLFSKMNSEIDKNNEAIKDMSNKKVKLDEIVKYLTNSVRNHCQVRINAFKLTDAVNIKRNKVRNKITKKHHHNAKDESKKRLDQPRSFVLPPEYDPKDSKWTLKHRKATRGTVEIIPGSHIFVNARQFAHCKRVAKNYRTLARMLLTEIFSINALEVCSLTGTRAKAFGDDFKEVRPGLDEHARMVLYNYVNEHAIKKGWVKYDSHAVVSTVRSKIQDIRSKANMK